MTKTAIDALKAANYANTIAQAFEANGLDMDGWTDLWRELSDLQFDYLIMSPAIEPTERIDAALIAKCLAIIQQSVNIVSAVIDAAMAESAAHTRAMLNI